MRDAPGPSDQMVASGRVPQGRPIRRSQVSGCRRAVRSDGRRWTGAAGPSDEKIRKDRTDQTVAFRRWVGAAGIATCDGLDRMRAVDRKP
eukprot:2062203-Pyramimonas_sp.AAC.1